MSIVAVAPGGQRGAHPLGTHTIAGGGRVDFTIPVGELAVQSVGVATFVTVVASYEISQPVAEPAAPGSDGSSQARQMALTESAPPRFVTFEPGFGSAIIRTVGAQSSENTRVMRNTQTVPTPSELRGYDSRLGVLTALSTAPVALGDGTPGTTTFYETPVSELPIPHEITGGTP